MRTAASPAAMAARSCTRWSRNSANCARVALAVKRSITTRSITRRASNSSRASRGSGVVTKAPRAGINVISLSCASRFSAWRIVVRETPKISPNATSPSLAPGGRRCSINAAVMRLTMVSVLDLPDLPDLPEGRPAGRFRGVESLRGGIPLKLYTIRWGTATGRCRYLKHQYRADYRWHSFLTVYNFTVNFT